MAVDSSHLRKLLRSVDGYITTELKAAASEHAPWLSPLLVMLAEQGLTPPWSTFLHDLGANTAAIGLFNISHEGAWEFLQRFAKSSISTPDDLAMLRSVAPVVYNVVREGGDVMPVIMPILQHLLTKIEHILAYNPHHTSAEVNASDTSFPCMPSISVRGVYVKDRDASSKQVCTKNAPQHKTLSPGVLTFNCKHGEFCETHCYTV